MARQKTDRFPEQTPRLFIERLKALQSDAELQKIQRYFKSGKGEYGEGDKFMGVRMGSLFALSKEFLDMPVAGLEKLLENKIHEVRAGAVSIMNQACRKSRITPERHKELYDLYLKRHDRINNWDLVDLGAPYVIGRYLKDKPRDILYKLARSASMWERRTAITATGYFILKQKETTDAFRLAEILVGDAEDLIHKAAGGWVRAAGGPDPKGLSAFLDKFAGIMPRTMLRYAIEHLPPKRKVHYMKLKDKQDLSE
jgi:3-methyladenine DNA glycosylase AlkD